MYLGLCAAGVVLAVPSCRGSAEEAILAVAATVRNGLGARPCLRDTRLMVDREPDQDGKILVNSDPTTIPDHQQPM